MLYCESVTVWKRGGDAFVPSILSGVCVEENTSVALSGTARPLPTSSMKVFIPYEMDISTGDFVARGAYEELEPIDESHEVSSVQRFSLFGSLHHLEVMA